MTVQVETFMLWGDCAKFHTCITKPQVYPDSCLKISIHTSAASVDEFMLKRHVQVPVCHDYTIFIVLFLLVKNMQTWSTLVHSNEQDLTFFVISACAYASILHLLTTLFSFFFSTITITKKAKHCLCKPRNLRNLKAFAILCKVIVRM